MLRFPSSLLQNPVDYLLVAQRALTDVVKSINEQFSKDHAELFVGLDGNFGSHHVTPRGLSASFLGQVICLEGIITKCYEVRAKVIKSVHYVPKTGKQLVQNYSDAASLNGRKTTVVYPKEDENGNALTTEFGLSVYHDNQIVTMQEMPERAPAGQLPRSIDIILSNDLVDTVKPGDRVRITGIYRAFPSKSNNSTSGVFKTALLGTYIERINKIGIDINITKDEVRKIRELAKEFEGAKVFHHLAKSIAPSIYGQEFIKRAVLCMLLGGVEKNLDNGAHLRGDVNVLMVGDPSTAKSQVLRFVLNTAPLAVATTGRGSSGVGLTAAVLTDMDTGEKRLEAGAMVLADRGVVCIDEFDKMSEADRVAIHEVMEQQTVTINKAAIHTTLNARCSVLAAANPIYGQYKTDMTMHENVGLPDSLLSRFDLLFIVLDTVEANHDRRISQHVLRNHTYRAPNEPDGYVNPAFTLGSEGMVAGTVDDDIEEDRDDDIYEKPKTSIHQKGRSKADRILKLSFLKKYLFFAKRKFKPTLTQEASDFISSQYAELRSERAVKNQPITARTLETMIRLSTAIARCRLSETVTKDDAIEALGLLKYALYSELPEGEHDEETTTFKRAEKLQREQEEQQENDPNYRGAKRTADEEAEGPAKRTRQTGADEPLVDGLPQRERAPRPKRATQTDSSQSQPTESEATQETQEDDDDVPMDLDVSDPPTALDHKRKGDFARVLRGFLSSKDELKAPRKACLQQLKNAGFTEGQFNVEIQKLLNLGAFLYEDGTDLCMLSD